MSIFRFTARPRKKNSNEPLTYDIVEVVGVTLTKPPSAGKTEQKLGEAGILVRQKNKWRLRWRGIAAEFDTKIQLQRHFALLGHRIEGLA